MPKKDFNIKIVVHFPAGAGDISYNKLLNRFRIEQIKKAIAMYPQKTRLAILDWLLENIAAFE